MIILELSIIIHFSDINLFNKFVVNNKGFNIFHVNIRSIQKSFNQLLVVLNNIKYNIINIIEYSQYTYRYLIVPIVLSEC